MKFDLYLEYRCLARDQNLPRRKSTWSAKSLVPSAQFQYCYGWKIPKFFSFNVTSKQHKTAKSMKSTTTTTNANKTVPFPDNNYRFQQDNDRGKAHSQESDIYITPVTPVQKTPPISHAISHGINWEVFSPPSRSAFKQRRVSTWNKSNASITWHVTICKRSFQQ